MKIIVKLGFCLVMISICFTTFAQPKDASKKQMPTKIDSIIQKQNFTFYASQALPMRGTSRILTGEYTLKITKDTIVVYLPFFGRAYTAPLNPSESGIEFMSKNFDYQKKITRKGCYEIQIIPRDVPNSYHLYLSVYNNGYATLNVNSNQRESISFYGTVK